MEKNSNQGINTYLNKYNQYKDNIGDTIIGLGGLELIGCAAAYLIDKKSVTEIGLGIGIIIGIGSIGYGIKTKKY